MDEEMNKAIESLTEQLSAPDLAEDEFFDLIRRRRVLVAERDRKIGS